MRKSRSEKAKAEAEQTKWPNRTHKRNASEWAAELGKEFFAGARHGALWPAEIYGRLAEISRGGRAIDALDFGEKCRYAFFPYRISSFTMLRLAGTAFSASLLGYLMCFAGTKPRLGALSYAGLVYFLYLLAIALFILYLEVAA